jgi:hypothetical protein
VGLAQSPLLEGKFTVKIDQWAGLFSDEFIHPNPNTAIDMMNFTIKNEGGRSFLEQRQGWIRVYPPAPAEADQMRGIYICQIASDSERIIVAGVSEFYEIAPNAATPVWYAMTSGGNNTAANCSFTQFKDTIIASGNGKVFRFAKNPGGSAGIREVGTGLATTYQRFFLHQDRIYGYGIDNDSTDSKLAWWPEFDIYFGQAHYDSMLTWEQRGIFTLIEMTEILLQMLYQWITT